VMLRVKRIGQWSKPSASMTVAFHARSSIMMASEMRKRSSLLDTCRTSERLSY
jgi:hypothetical protein